MWMSRRIFENYVRCDVGKFVLVRMSHALKSIWHSWLLSINCLETLARGFLSITITTKIAWCVFQVHPWVVLPSVRPILLRWNILPCRIWVWDFIYLVSGGNTKWKKWLLILWVLVQSNILKSPTQLPNPGCHFWQHTVVNLKFLIWYK